MNDTKAKSKKNQLKITKDVRVSVPKNTDRLPLFLASNPKELTMQIPLEPITHPEGGILERIITIDPWNYRNSKGKVVPKYLNTTTLEYWFWICRLWQEMPEPERSQGIVIWTRYELLRLMGKTTSGKSCQIHDDHTTRLAAVTFFLGDCFFNSVDNQHMKSLKLFSIFSELELTEMKNGEVVTLDKCRAKIHPLIVQNQLNNFTKPINLSTYSSIPAKANLARKLYAKLDTQFSHYLKYEISTERFFRENGIIGKEYNRPAKRKENLENAIKQITDKKFSSGKVIKDYKFQKTADGNDWKIIVWAYKLEASPSPVIEVEPAQKTPSKEDTNKDFLVTTEVLQKARLKPISQSLHSGITPKPKNTELKDTAKFINQFFTLFPNAEKEKISKSRAITQKVETFINDTSITKALDFLSYCHELSQNNQFSMLGNAQTPNYLFSFKVGDNSIIHTWQQDRAAKNHRKLETEKTNERRLEYFRSQFEDKIKPTFQKYIDVFISGLSEENQLSFEEFFQKKEEVMLKSKKESYKKLYFTSNLLQKQFSFDCLRKFSMRLPKPVLSQEQWIEAHYPEEYKRFYR